ncbi:Uncharacterized protein APZ42_009833, partial [Daphnia magna]
TIEEHFTNFKTVFSLLENAHLKMKLSKCEFLAQSVSYLGHVITTEGIKPDPAKIDTLVNYKRPGKVKELQSFWGQASYYRRFVKNFSTVAHLLLSQTKGKPTDSVTWKTDEIAAFEYLRQCLISEPILIYRDFSKEFLIYTDASNYGLGAV